MAFDVRAWRRASVVRQLRDILSPAPIWRVGGPALTAPRVVRGPTLLTLMRLYEAIENGVADLAYPRLNERVAELTATGINRASTRSARRRKWRKRGRRSRRRRSPHSPGRRASGCATPRAATAPSARPRPEGRSPRHRPQERPAPPPWSPRQREIGGNWRPQFCSEVARPRGFRTSDLCLRRAALYPAELRAQARSFSTVSAVAPQRRRLPRDDVPATC